MIAISLRFYVLIAIPAYGDDDSDVMAVLAYVEQPFAALNTGNSLLLGDLPSRAITVEPSDMRDAFVGVVSISFSYAFNLVRHLSLQKLGRLDDAEVRFTSCVSHWMRTD